jgi:predicted dehydrogenase
VRSARGSRRIGRRGLLQGALAAATAGRIPRLARPSDAWRLGLIGLGARGTELLTALRALPGVRVSALCDVDERALARAVRRSPDSSERPGTYVDCRDLLERSAVDAVVIATPNHWHALQTVWACQAGKDVYLEGLAAHHFGEGAPLLAAVRAAGRRVQCALPARASPALREAVAWVRAGNLGAIELVRVWCSVPRAPIGDTKGNQRIPELVDYDLWCGPAPLVPLRRAELHGDWRWTFATGAGELGERAAPLLDTARWVLGAEALPEAVTSVGARLGPPDDGETPNVHTLLYATRPAPILCAIHGLAPDTAGGGGASGSEECLTEGVVVEAAGGTLLIAGHGQAVALDAGESELRRFEGRGDPLAEWVRACTGPAGDAGAPPAAGVESALRSSALVHLGNASHRVGTPRPAREVPAALAELPLLAAAAEELREHLAQRGLEREMLVLGPTLALDAERACFRDHERANQLLRGSHRDPFLLPGA